MAGAETILAAMVAEHLRANVGPAFSTDRRRYLADVDPAAVVHDPGADRLAADARLFTKLQEIGFTGPGWDHFSRKFASYAIGILEAWMGSGHIFTVLKNKGIRFTPSPWESHRLVYDLEFRSALVDTAVTEALGAFRRRGLDGTGWRAEGGASLATYFVVACLHATANELHKQRRRDERDRKSHVAALREELSRPSQDRYVSDDPSQRAIDNLILREHLSALDPGDRNIVWGKASGLSNREIAEIYGERSARTVERRWSWLVSHVDWIGRLAGKESK